jgi:hypothetical protein
MRVATILMPKVLYAAQRLRDVGEASRFARASQEAKRDASLTPRASRRCQQRTRADATVPRILFLVANRLQGYQGRALVYSGELHLSLRPGETFAGACNGFAYF